jgi:hypothetical protein
VPAERDSFYNIIRNFDEPTLSPSPATHDAVAAA